MESYVFFFQKLVYITLGGKQIESSVYTVTEKKAFEHSNSRDTFCMLQFFLCHLAVDISFDIQ